VAVCFLLEPLLQPPTRPFASFFQHFQFDVPQRPSRWFVRIHIPFDELRFMFSDEEPFHALHYGGGVKMRSKVGSESGNQASVDSNQGALPPGGN
jgi:hypothetical protein